MAYVYRHIRLDKNEPFYIGVGSDDRYKRANERARRSEIWKRVVAKTDYEIEILIENVSFEYALEKEKEFIALYGRKDKKTGCLVNLTSGGDGAIDRIFTLEHRRKLSEANLRRHAHKVKPIKMTRKEQDFLCSKRMKENNPMAGIIGKNSPSFKGYVCVFKNGNKVGVFEGVNDASRKLDIQASKISACLKGKRNKTGGYTFERIGNIYL
jgi:hypothetical protein